MEKINYEELTELTNWVGKFKLFFTDEDVINNLEKVEAVLSNILEARRNQAAENSASSVKSAPAAMDYESYKDEYLRLFELLIATGITITDPVEYFEFRNVVSEAKDKLTSISGNPKKVFEDIAKLINENGRIYKNLIYDSESFSDIDIERIKAINALQNLELDMKAGITSLNAHDGINHLLIVKTVQAILAKGIKSNTELYRKDFFDYEKLFRAEKDYLTAKPFVQKYQKAVSMKDRKALLYRTDEELLTIFSKTLKQTPQQLLEYSPEYNDITKK